MPSLITRAAVHEALSRSESDLRECWSHLSGIAKRGASSADAQSMRSFQPRLAKALLDLSHLNTRVRRYEKQLHARRTRVSKTWFSQRRAAIERYRKAIAKLTRIARTLGDMFVWPFYAKDRELLRQHLAAPPLAPPPATNGSAAELSFMAHSPVIDRYILLLHGTTHLLRVGDVSLYDMDSRRIAGLGELKAQPPSGGKVQVSLTAHTPAGGPMQVRPDAASPSALAMSPEMSERLERQMRAIETTFQAQAADIQVKLVDDTHVSDLNALGADLKTSRTSFQQGSPGLLIGGARLPARRSLTARMLDPSMPRVVESFASRLTERVPDVLMDSSPWNSPCLNFLDAQVPPGQPPWIWLGVDPDLVEGLLFQTIHVATLHNTAFLLAELEQSGFKVAAGRKGGPEITAKFDRAEIVVFSLTDALRAVRKGLARDGTVARLMKEILERAREGDLEGLDALDVFVDLYHGPP